MSLDYNMSMVSKPYKPRKPVKVTYARPVKKSSVAPLAKQYAARARRGTSMVGV